MSTSATPAAVVSAFTIIIYLITLSIANKHNVVSCEIRYDKCLRGGCKMSLRTSSLCSYIFLVPRDHWLYVCLHLKIEFCSCDRGRQWCGIFHYHWWTASIKPRLLFCHAGLVSWGLSLSSVNETISYAQHASVIIHNTLYLHTEPVDGVWSAWSAWFPCPVTCGTGLATRYRNCTFNGIFHGQDCPGNPQETKDCNTQLCPCTN